MQPIMYQTDPGLLESNSANSSSNSAVTKAWINPFSLVFKVFAFARVIGPWGHVKVSKGVLAWLPWACVEWTLEGPKEHVSGLPWADDGMSMARFGLAMRCFGLPSLCHSPRLGQWMRTGCFGQQANGQASLAHPAPLLGHPSFHKAPSSSHAMRSWMSWLEHE